MRNISISDLITKSVDRTKFILFPISFKKWLYLLFIAYMAGAIGGGGSGGGNSIGGNEKNAEASTKAEYVLAQNNQPLGIITNDDLQMLEDYAQEEGKSIGFTQPKEAEHFEMFDEDNESIQSFPEFFSSIPKSYYPLILLAFISIIVLSIVFAWLSSRFKFIWFNAIHNDVFDIKVPFKQYKTEGNSLFIISLMLSISCLLIILALGAIAFFSLNAAGAFSEGFTWTFGFGFKTLAFPILMMIVVGAAFGILTVVIDHFVVTIMAMDKCTFKPALNKFLNIYLKNIKDFWIYLCVIIGLGIACGILGTIIAIIAIIAIVIVAAIVFGLLFVIFQLILKANIVFGIVAIVLGIPFILATVVLLSMVGLPFAVFFRNFSLYFLSSLNCDCSPLALDNADDLNSLNI